MTQNQPTPPHGANDRHTSFADFDKTRLEGWDYDIFQQQTASPVAVISIHGGIEKGMTELARIVAGTEHNLFAFHSYEDESRFFDVHITSNRYDEPHCVNTVLKSEFTISDHGCRATEEVVYIGGLDTALGQSIADEFNRRGIKAMTDGHIYPADVPENICNRNIRVPVSSLNSAPASVKTPSYCANAPKACAPV